MYLFVKLLCFFLLWLPADPPADRISWSADQPLSWQDFKGQPQSGSHLHAYSMTSIKTDFISHDGESAVLEVNGYFDRARSWVKKGHENDHLLRHEQLHFDLSELYRRKLMKAMESFDGFTFKNFSKEANRIFKEVFEELTREQKRYDYETQHSQIASRQEEWSQRIAEELQQWRDYAGRRITVAVHP